MNESLDLVFWFYFVFVCLVFFVSVLEGFLGCFMPFFFFFSNGVYLQIPEKK